MALESESPRFADNKTEYTCPMHPEVVRAQPGSCPVCGMALEPRTVTVEEAQSRTARHDAALLDQLSLSPRLCWRLPWGACCGRRPSCAQSRWTG
jgi:hypothetical protein